MLYQKTVSQLLAERRILESQLSRHNRKVEQQSAEDLVMIRENLDLIAAFLRGESVVIGEWQNPNPWDKTPECNP